jgi:hypothetical protein
MSAVGTWLRDAAAVARQTVREPQAFQIKAAEGLLLQTAMILLVWPPAEHLWIGRNRGNSCLTAIAARWLMLVEDPGSTRPERHFASGAAQTRTVSVGRIRLDSWKFMRSYKGIICGDISEFESYHPSHAVGCRFRKVRFVRSDDVARQGSDRRQCLRIARSGVCRARPSRAKRESAPHYNRSHILQEFVEGALR